MRRTGTPAARAPRLGARLDVRLDRAGLRVRGSTRRLERPVDAIERGSVGARAGHRGRGGSGAARGVRAAPAAATPTPGALPGGRVRVAGRGSSSGARSRRGAGPKTRGVVGTSAVDVRRVRCTSARRPRG